MNVRLNLAYNKVNVANSGDLNIVLRYNSLSDYATVSIFAIYTLNSSPSGAIDYKLLARLVRLSDKTRQLGTDVFIK